MATIIEIVEQHLKEVFNPNSIRRYAGKHFERLDLCIVDGGGIYQMYFGVANITLYSKVFYYDDPQFPNNLMQELNKLHDQYLRNSTIRPRRINKLKAHHDNNNYKKLHRKRTAP